MTTMSTPHSPSGFAELGLAPRILAILGQLKFTEPTPIQREAIPIAKTGKDLVGIAQTGTGKTLAFGLPLIERLMTEPGTALIILPTRELAIQVDEVLAKIGGQLGFSTAVLIGGTPMGPQLAMLRRGPRIVIGTPGRIIDHLEGRRLDVSRTAILVLDEADRMLDMGFAPQIKRILGAIPRERQTMLFSATMPEEILKIATGHMRLPVRIEIARSGTTAEHIEQEFFVVGRHDKNRLLDKILAETPGTVLVFARTKFGAKRITGIVRAMGHSAAEIHSNRSLGQRRDALEGFKTGRYRVLVATDIASRGIDVRGIALVINYDLPSDSDDYVHRIGRTGRAGMAGKAISFIMPEERRKLHEIERLIRKAITVSRLPELPPERPQARQAAARVFAPAFGGRQHSPYRGTPSHGGRSSPGFRRRFGGPRPNRSGTARG
mgnify:FL=1